MIPSFSLSANGDNALDIRFDADPCEGLSRWIIVFEQAINAQEWDGVQDLIPAYQCLTICFDPLLCDRNVLNRNVEALARALLTQKPALERKPHLIRIPVCYDAEFAQDMPAVAEQTGLSTQQIIAKHASVQYLVHMLGFSPGFLYLGGLDPALHCPRKETPAVRVPAGAVGIGGEQTGIYPQATPGGWQIIGRTPVELFAPQSDRPFVAEPLDRIEFYPIDRAQFESFEQDMLEISPLEQST